MSKAEANLAKIEFIESYVKIGSSDYQWNDNHGELIRCKNCALWVPEEFELDLGRCKLLDWIRSGDWFCADGVKKDG